MFEYSSILLLLIALPLIGIIFLLFIPNTESNLQKSVGLSVSLLTFFISILLWLKFDMSTSKYQFVEKFFSVPYSNMHIYIGVDIFTSVLRIRTARNYMTPDNPGTRLRGFSDLLTFPKK